MRQLVDLRMKADSSYVKSTIADLLQNKIDMSQLVITKALAKAGQLNVRGISVELMPRLRCKAGSRRIGREDEEAGRRFCACSW